MKAIEKLEGHMVKGKKMKVSLARYNKGGGFIDKDSGLLKSSHPYKRTIRFRFLRDSQRYDEVVKGKQSIWSLIPEGNIIPMVFTIKLDENQDMVNKLKHAIIAESAEPLCLPQIIKDKSVSETPIYGMYTLSPCKMLRFFNNENDMNNVLEEGSVLWNVFDDLRRWSEGESFNDRLVWLECFGIDPKSWCLDNIRSIGKKWGSVLYVDRCHDVVPCLTHAHMLIRTKAQNRIDVRIRVLHGRSSYDVWVKESGGCGCNISNILAMKNGSNNLGELNRSSVFLDVGITNDHGPGLKTSVGVAHVIATSNKSLVIDISTDNRLGVKNLMMQEAGEQNVLLGDRNCNIQLENHVDNPGVKEYLWEDPSIDVVLNAHLSCPSLWMNDCRFDPMASLECP